MKRCLLPLLYICIAQTLCAQAPLVKMWDARFGGTSFDALVSVQQTNDKGYILGGTSNSDIGGDKTESSWGEFDYWLVKVDSVGNKQWDRRFGGTDNDQLLSTQQTSDGGYICGGFSTSEISGDRTQGSRGNMDFWIVKTDAFGNKQWDRRFGGTSIDWLYSLDQTTDGGYILGGISYSGISGDKTQANWDSTWGTYDYWIVKIDSLGNKQWDRRYGGIDNDRLISLQQTFDGGYILGGYSTTSDTSGDKSQPNWSAYPDFWVVKIDSAGNKQWDKCYGAILHENLYSLQQTTDGGYILGGRSNSDAGGDRTDTLRTSYDFWIVKIDSGGNKQWDKAFGGTSYQEPFGNIVQTFDGGYLMEGLSLSDAGGDKSEDNLGDAQNWIIKTDSLGNKQWDKTIFSTGWDGFGKAIQANDSCYVIATHSKVGIGGYKSQPNQDTTNLTSDYWIIKFRDTTSVFSCTSLNITTNSVTAHVTCIGASDGAAKAVVSGGTEPYTFLWSDGQADDSPTDLSAGAHSVTVTDANGCTATTSIDIGEGTEPCVGIQDNSFNNIILHPNPTNNSLTITATINEQAMLTLVDALGKEVWQQAVSAEALKAGAQLSLKEQEQGIYFLSIRTAQGSQVMKVVKY